MTDYNSFPAVTEQVEKVVGRNGLNLLINNAGVMPPNSMELDTLTPEAMVLGFEVNCLGPLFFTRALLPLLKIAANTAEDSSLSVRRAAVVQMSTGLASIGDNGNLLMMGKHYAYRCSKVALNMAMKNLSLDLTDMGVLIMALCPGWVQTDMGAAAAPGLVKPDSNAEISCKRIVQTLDGLKDKDHGSFLRYNKPNNTIIPW